MSTSIPLLPVYDFMTLPLPVSVKVAESEISTLLLTQLPRIRMTTLQNLAGRSNAPTSWFSLVYKISRKNIVPSHQTGGGVAQPV
jgi:hypothetical protein